MVGCRQIMYSDDEMDFEPEQDSEMLEYETATLASLRTKELVVKNSDGSLRCPISPSRKKQSYAYKDLLQHAAAVAGGKRGSEAAGKHSALKKYLESDLVFLATPAVERAVPIRQEFLRRKETAELFVRPWSVVIFNMKKNGDQEGSTGSISKSDFKKLFAGYNPEKAHLLWNHTGHLGMGVLQFGRELSGLQDAQALEESFNEKERGRRDYLRNSCSPHGLGNGYYGWLAREGDLLGQPGYDFEMAKYLNTYGDLTGIANVGETIKKMYFRQVEHLQETVSAKNKEFQMLRTETEIIRRNAEADRLKLEEYYKQELEAVRSKALNSEKEYNELTSRRSQELERKAEELLRLEKDLQLKESYLKSTTDKTLLDAQKTETVFKRDLISKQQDLQKQHQADKVKLIQKHQEENKKMQIQMHNMSLILAKKQQNEMEKQQLQDMLQTQKIFDKLKINGDGGEETKKIDELKKRLEELESNEEFNMETINALVIKDREATDEIMDARKMSAEVIRRLKEKPKGKLIEAALTKKKELEGNKNKSHPPLVGLKMAGEIDHTSWGPACKQRYKNVPDGWDVSMKLEFSKWEDLVRDSDFQPFKNVNLGGDKWKQEINHEDDRLSSLKKELGDAVYNSVTSALLEIEEHNPSGRYPIPIAWIFEESRRASLKEVIAHLAEVIDSLILMAQDNPRKKVRN